MQLFKSLCLIYLATEIVDVRYKFTYIRNGCCFWNTSMKILVNHGYHVMIETVNNMKNKQNIFQLYTYSSSEYAVFGTRGVTDKHAWIVTSFIWCPYYNPKDAYNSILQQLPHCMMIQYCRLHMCLK